MKGLFRNFLALGLIAFLSVAQAESLPGKQPVKKQLYECGNVETALGELGQEFLMASASTLPAERQAVLTQASVGYFFIKLEDCFCKKQQAGKELDKYAILSCFFSSKQAALAYFDLNNIPGGKALDMADFSAALLR